MTRARVIRPEQVEAIRGRMVAARDRLLVTLLFYCGLRPEEALALTWADVGERTIVTDKAYTHGELGPTRTHRSRSVALIPAVSAELESLRSSPASLVFASRAGTHLNLNNLRNRAWQPAVGAEGQDGLRRYDGRHTFASLLIEEAATSARCRANSITSRRRPRPSATHTCSTSPAAASAYRLRTQSQAFGECSEAGDVVGLDTIRRRRKRA